MLLGPLQCEKRGGAQIMHFLGGPQQLSPTLLLDYIVYIGYPFGTFKGFFGPFITLLESPKEPKGPSGYLVEAHISFSWDQQQLSPTLRAPHVPTAFLETSKHQIIRHDVMILCRFYLRSL